MAAGGICSRRKAEILISQGAVSVNDVPVTTLGFKVKAEDVIKVNGEIVKQPQKVVYLLNKPEQVISAVGDDRGRLSVTDLVDSPYRLFPIGRLDYDSCGLILLTNDGELANLLLHPRYMIEKVYEVTIKGAVKEEDLQKLRQGVKLEDYQTAPAEIKVINKDNKTTRLRFTIHEGHKRQIRKMLEKYGYSVLKLKRIQEANISLGNLKPGAYRKLSQAEIKALFAYLNQR